jgi:uncharacterized membrane protein YGL010W
MQYLEDNTIDSDSIYLFFESNRRYIKGLTRWNEQRRRNLFEATMSVPLAILLMSFLVLSPDLTGWIKTVLVASAGLLISGLFVFFYLKMSRESFLAKNGKILLGHIIDCSITNKFTDTYDVYKITYSFKHQVSFTEVPMSKDAAYKLNGRQVVILYFDENTFTVL